MHDHEHEHSHDEDHEHNHDHEHLHSHDEAHDHAHDEHSHEHAQELGEVYISIAHHEDALVVSGSLAMLSHHPRAMHVTLRQELSFVANAVERLGGTIGHVKASMTATSIDSFSITDPSSDVQATRSDDIEVYINTVAIVFSVPEQDIMDELAAALAAVRDAGETGETD
jgi:hypothetical protein